MGKFRVGIIGLGGMAQSHIRGLQAIDSFEIMAICDIVEEKCKAVGDQLTISIENQYIDFRKLIDSGKVDAVISATPNNVHAEILSYCIEKNMPILAEKPFTLNYKEALELAEKYERNPIPCMVGFSYRYTPAFRYVKSLVESGKIGNVRSFSIQYLQGWGSPHFQTPYVWRFNSEITGTGVLGDLGSHMIDMAHFLFGSFEEVSAQMESLITKRKKEKSEELEEFKIDDFASFQARMSNGLVGTFQTTRNALGSGNQHEVSIYGDRGTLHASTNDEGNIHWIYIDEETNKIVEDKVAVPDSVKQTEWEEFAQMLNGKTNEGFPDFYAGLENQKVLEAIIQSSKQPGFKIETVE